MLTIPTFQLVNQKHKNGKQWALFVHFRMDSRWVIERWDARPSEQECRDTVNIFLRSISIYIAYLNSTRLEVGHEQWLVEGEE